MLETACPLGSAQSHNSSSVERYDLLIPLWHWQAAILIEVFLDFSPESPGGLGGLGPSEPQTKPLRFKSLHPMREGGGRKRKKDRRCLGKGGGRRRGGFLRLALSCSSAAESMDN